MVFVRINRPGKTASPILDIGNQTYVSDPVGLDYISR